MSKYFNINGSAMIYIPQSSELKNAKTTEEANNLINKECQIIIEKFKNKLQEIAKQNPEVFDEISFEGFYPLGLDIHCFQNQAHGPSTDLDNIENGKRIHIHDTATLTINGTIETDCYKKHQQLFIDAFQQTFKNHELYRLNLITMSGFKQDAIVFDTFGIDNIITVPLTRSDKKELVLEKLNDVIKYIKWHITY